MAADNNSVFEDEKELEKYGVWVKTGPEEIDDIDDDINFDLSDLEDEAIISDEEEEMLGKLENELSQENIGITENNLNLSESMENKDLDFEDLEEVEIGELLEEDELEVSALNTVKNEEVFDLDIDFDDDLNSPADNKSELPSAENSTITEIMSTESNSEIEDFDLDEIEDIDLDADFNIDDMEMLGLDEELPVEIDMDSIQNVELEDDIVDFDVDEILKNPENDLDDLDVDLLLEEDSEELVEFEEPNEVDELIELEETDEILEAEEIDDLSSVDELEEIQDIVLPINDSSEITVDFDETERIIEDLTDLDDLEEIDFEESEAPEVSAKINQKETGDLASEILLKIEKELQSIKSELHDVK
ncbi:MAG: hypothetical protein L3J12_00495, partial [Spirochaetales bacterium]|nr:hypothetical protein [Spirochaetales bacterium]